MNKHCRFKTWQLICIGILLLVSLFFFLYWISGSTVAEIQPVSDLSLVLGAQEGGNCCIESNSTVWSLSKTGVLKVNSTEDADVVRSNVFQMLPVDNGVAYTIVDTLYYSQEREHKKIAEGVSTFGRYGSRLVYATKEGAIYLWQDQKSTLLTALEGTLIYALLGNEEYLFIYGDSFYVYHEDFGLQNTEILHNSLYTYFIYGNDLVLIGGTSKGGIVYNPETHSRKELDLGFSLDSYFNEISVTADNQWVYLSMKVKSWPPLDSETQTATFRINPTDWHAELISEKHYPNLVYGKNGLYDFDIFKQRGKLIQEGTVLREPS